MSHLIDDSSLFFLGDVYLPKAHIIPIKGHVVFNHEFVISNPEDKPCVNKVNLVVRKNAVPESFPYATKLYAHMDNNHVMDFGEEALKRTIRMLSDKGVYCYGSNIHNQSTIIHCLNSVKFCLLGYNMTAPSQTMTPESIISIIKNDIPDARKNGAERIILTIHFGEENMPRAFPKQAEVARAAIDLGAEIVVGHHTHCVQNIELYKGKHIFYGLGNTYFPELDVLSYYDSSGVAHDRFRIRNTKWNSSGLIVKYNILDGNISLVTTSCPKGTFHLGKETSANRINRGLIFKYKPTGYIRRAYGFLKNYTFYDGKIFDVNKLAIKINEKLKQ